LSLRSKQNIACGVPPVALQGFPHSKPVHNHFLKNLH